MIEKDIDIIRLNEIFKKYKNNYNPIINEFTHNIVYTVEKNIVAFILYTNIYENCEIIDIFVLQEYRNKNIGSLLLEEFIKNNLTKNITLEVNINNKPAINLYKKFGFEQVAIRKGYYNGVDGILMLKK